MSAPDFPLLSVSSGNPAFLDSGTELFWNRHFFISPQRGFLRVKMIVIGCF